MNEIMRLQVELNNRLARLNEGYVKRFGLQTDSIPISAFNMAYVKNVMSLEVFSYYWEVWGIPRDLPVGATKEQVIRENGKRLIDVLTSQLITALSAFEFSAKSAISISGSVVKNKPKGRTYFGYILEQSEKLAVISSDDLEGWSALIDLRNSFVHCNAYAEADKTYSVPNFPVLIFIDGKQIELSIKSLFHCIQWSVEAYARWCDGMFRLGGNSYISNVVKHPVL